MSPLKWILLTAFVVSAYWFWALYVIMAILVLGAYLDTGNSSRSTPSKRRPHRFKTAKRTVPKPPRYRPAKPHRFPKTRRKWGRPVKIDKVWKL